MKWEWILMKFKTVVFADKNAFNDREDKSVILRECVSCGYRSYSELIERYLDEEEFKLQSREQFRRNSAIPRKKVKS